MNGTCFMCGYYGEMECVRTSGDPRGSVPYFPWLRATTPAPGAVAPSAVDGTVLGCVLCARLMTEQWKLHESRQTPVSKRQYWMKGWSVDGLQPLSIEDEICAGEITRIQHQQSREGTSSGIVPPRSICAPLTNIYENLHESHSKSVKTELSTPNPLQHIRTNHPVNQQPAAVASTSLSTSNASVNPSQADVMKGEHQNATSLLYQYILQQLAATQASGGQLTEAQQMELERLGGIFSSVNSKLPSTSTPT